MKMIAGRTNATVEIKIGRITHDFERGIRQGWFKAGNVLIAEIKDQVSAPKSGALRRIGGRFHRASAGGETPARLSGKYVKSMGYQLTGWESLEFGSRTEGGADYAVFLEGGTSRMEARPGLKNTVDAKQEEVLSLLEQQIQAALR